MPYLFLLLLVISLGSCQSNLPNKEDQQRAEQIAAEQEVEADFEKALRLQRETLTSQQQASTQSVSPQKAVELLNTAQLLFNLDSNGLSTTTHTNDLSAAPQHGGVLLRVRNHKETYQQIRDLAKEQGLTILQETEQIAKYKKGSIIQLQTKANQLQPTLDKVRDWAAVLRKKQLWQMPSNNDHFRIKSAFIITKQRLEDLRSQLKETEKVSDQLLLKERVAQLAQNLELTVLSLREQASQTSPSILTIAFYEELTPVAPVPTTFSADLSGNLEAGWIQFKQFLLQAALVWPYIILGLLFLITVLLAVGNSRRKAREFKLQLLHKQQPIVQPVIVDDNPL
ncbi:MAG: DUF4349 domain-containing protein [Aureispira sp.]